MVFKLKTYKRTYIFVFRGNFGLFFRKTLKIVIKNV